MINIKNQRVLKGKQILKQMKTSNAQRSVKQLYIWSIDLKKET